MNFGLDNIGSEIISFFVPKISGKLFPIPFAILTVWHSEHMFTGTYLLWDPSTIASWTWYIIDLIFPFKLLDECSDYNREKLIMKRGKYKSCKVFSFY